MQDKAYFTMPIDPDTFGQPVDSDLHVTGMFTVVNRQGSNPPTMQLTLDVEHAENPAIAWRVGVNLNREQIIELTNLMVSCCDKHELPIRADGEQ